VKTNDTQITELPETLANDPAGFFEALKLADLESKWLRLSFAVQRRFFGRVPFGKKAVKVSECGEVRTYQTAGFGQDWDEQIYRFDFFKGCFRYASTGDEARI
jgi:hypothetical protein